MCHFRTAEDQKKSGGQHFSAVFVTIPYCTRICFFSGVSPYAGGEPSQDLRIIANLALGRKFCLFSNEATPEFNHLVHTA